MPAKKPGAKAPPLLESLRLRIVYRRIDELAPYEGNARTHSAKQITQIAASIRHFGFTNPVLIGDTGQIVAGHGRVAAARQLGMRSTRVTAPGRIRRMSFRFSMLVRPSPNAATSGSSVATG